ncbi:hypothetical protein CASFOL_024795 [Castilleja foliolosa]|uniref:Uncharacterized protein n=1 Tax=Castilleja foliolosa TaxID=1961234 RepID=A0ABD3CSJ2_9LAMI
MTAGSSRRLAVIFLLFVYVFQLQNRFLQFGDGIHTRGYI